MKITPGGFKYPEGCEPGLRTGEKNESVVKDGFFSQRQRSPMDPTRKKEFSLTAPPHSKYLVAMGSETFVENLYEVFTIS